MTLSAKQIIADREQHFMPEQRIKRLPALEDFYLSQQPRPISEAPEYARIIAIGWQAPSGSVRGYWWRHEDMTDEKGIPMDYPKATHFIPLDALPLPETDQ